MQIGPVGMTVGHLLVLVSMGVAKTRGKFRMGMEMVPVVMPVDVGVTQGLMRVSVHMPVEEEERDRSPEENGRDPVA